MTCNKPEKWSQRTISANILEAYDAQSKKVGALYTKLIRSKHTEFPSRGGKLHAPNRQGVYVIYDPRGAVVHVGRTPKAKHGIAQRLQNHMAGASSFTEKFLKGYGAKLRGKYTFQCLVVKNPKIRAYLEAYATGRLCPAHIGLG